MKIIKPAASDKCIVEQLHTNEKPNRVLKGIPPVKIIVNRVYVKGKQMDKAFSDYLSQQINKKDA